MYNKLFDLRFVIGAFFFIIGLLVLGYGFVSSDLDSKIINRGCGALFIAFGLLMILLSRKTDATDEVLDVMEK